VTELVIIVRVAKVIVVVGVIVVSARAVDHADTVGAMTFLQHWTEDFSALVIHGVRCVETFGHIVTLAVSADGLR